MRVTSLLLVGLVLFVAVFIPDGSEAVDSETPEDLEDFVFVESYKKVSSTHLVISPTTKSSYQNVVIYVFTARPVTVEVNGSEIYSFTPAEAGSKLLLTFDEGDKVDLRVSLGTSYYDYSFTVRKTISIKELDPEEDEEESFYSTGELVTVAVVVFLVGAFGVYAMFRFFKRRAMLEVRMLGPE